MIACVDVDYRPTETVAAALFFRAFADAMPEAERVARLPPAAPYEPGRFYLRELPALLAVLAQAPAPPSLVIVDGFVWLDVGRPGLGARLHEALGGTPVIGVAKRPFRDAPAIPVLRGASRTPLLVTAAGIDPRRAAEHVRAMHGAHRLPTLLRRVDRLCREA